MKLVYKGKTKDVYELEDGNFKLLFKDDVTGQGGVFDPGANTVGLQIKGIGNRGLAMSTHFFKLLQSRGIKTHWIATDLDSTSMTVRPAKAFGQGLEVICRYRAVGSFIRRYGKYIDSGAPLDALVEMTLKDDERGDPLATDDILAALGIVSHEQYAVIQAMMKNICAIIREALAEKGLELYDIKLEFGLVGDDIFLIDEISGGNMRVFQNGAAVDPMNLAAHFLF